MSEGGVCRRCYNQIHELNFLQNKIRILEGSLERLKEEVETGILSAYYREGDSPRETDSRPVAELKRRFYKSKYEFRIIGI
jgi:hypothetical protein